LAAQILGDFFPILPSCKKKTDRSLGGGIFWKRKRHLKEFAT